MTRLRTVAVLVLTGLVLALTGTVATAVPADTSAPNALASEDGRHCC